MPMSRSRGGSRMPCAGDDTTRPAMLMVPAVGCSSPATQRKVVVLPQPEGPSRTTISPDGTAKFTPSIAGRPTENCLRSSLTSSVAVMFCVRALASLAIVVVLVPVLDPIVVQLHIVVHFRQPDLDHLGIEAFGIERYGLERGEIAQFFDHEGLAFLRHAPVQEQLGGVRMLRRLRNAGRVGIHRRTLGREENLDRRAILLLRIDGVIEQGSHRGLAAYHGVG